MSRSPIAAALCRHELKDRDDIFIDSAGSLYTSGSILRETGQALDLIELKPLRYVPHHLSRKSEQEWDLVVIFDADAEPVARAHLKAKEFLLLPVSDPVDVPPEKWLTSHIRAREVIAEWIKAEVLPRVKR